MPEVLRERGSDSLRSCSGKTSSLATLIHALGEAPQQRGPDGGVRAGRSNALRKQYGVRVRLPALSLETPISRVVELFVQECQQGRVA